MRPVQPANPSAPQPRHPRLRSPQKAGDVMRRDGGAAQLLPAALRHGPTPLQHEPRLRADDQGVGEMLDSRSGGGDRAARAAAAHFQTRAALSDGDDAQGLPKRGGARYEEVERHHERTRMAALCRIATDARYLVQQGERSEMAPLRLCVLPAKLGMDDG